MPASPEEILRLDCLHLPASPPVKEISVYAFTDSIGDPALRVTVVVDVEPDSPESHWEYLSPIQDEIFRAVRPAGSASRRLRRSIR